MISPFHDPLTSLLCKEEKSLPSPILTSAEEFAFHENSLSGISSPVAAPKQVLYSSSDERGCLVTYVLSADASGSLPTALSRIPMHMSTLLIALKRHVEQISLALS